nr:ADP-ribosylation factor-like protein [Candidatus Sigynarchaeota archaeon]
MKILVLSHFDQKIGPTPFVCIPEGVNKDTLAQIADLINLYQNKAFFIHNVKGLKTANSLFQMINQKARASTEILLISIVLTEGDINTDVARDMLNTFIEEMKGITDIQAIFDHQSKAHDKAMVALKDLFTNFYNALPVEEVVQNRKDAKIFVFGLSKAGKTTIIRQLQNAKSKDTIPTTNVSMSRVHLNNMSLFVYDTPGQVKFRPLWAPYLKSQDALVFVFDVTDKDNYDNARALLHEVSNMETVKDLPLLILLNKVDIVLPDLDHVKKVLDIDNLEGNIHKIFLTSATTNKGIVESFNWLSSELLRTKDFIEPLAVSEDVSDCVIFSRWDELEGIEILSVYPENRVSDPELIAIRCLSIAEFIFGGQSFSEKVSFVLPIAHLKVRAAIYYDFIADKSVRGGKLPLSLVALFKEDTAEGIIEKAKPVMESGFEKMKNSIKDREQLRKILREIYEVLFTSKKAGEVEGKKSKPKGVSNNLNEFFKKF